MPDMIQPQASSEPILGAKAPDEMVRAAHAAADAAGAVIRGYFRGGELATRLKEDASPVTAADTAAEAAMREILEKAFPDHAVMGEESGGAGVELLATAEWAWCLDPIDGTKSFMSGRPTFGTLIALLHRGVPVFGIIDQPIARERWAGGTERPTLFNDALCRVRSKSSSLDDCVVHATTPEMFIGGDSGAFQYLRKHVRGAVYGGDCYAYALLASGHIELVVEADLKPWDFLALIPVVEGAGGFMRDWNGEQVGPRCDGRVVAAGSMEILIQATQILQRGLVEGQA